MQLFWMGVLSCGWPNHGTVGDFVKNVVSYTSHCLHTTNTYLILERYQNSTKEATRMMQAGKHARRRQQLSMNMPVTSQKICLALQHNKVQLISLICKYLKDQHSQLIFQLASDLVITGSDPVPFEYSDEEIHHRPDLRTTHKEAQVIIVQRVIHLTSALKRKVSE